MDWLLLVLASVPTYLLIGWTIFDTGEEAKDTFADTIMALLKIIFIPRIVRVLFEMDEEGASGIFPVALFVAGCVAVTYVEHLFLERYVL